MTENHANPPSFTADFIAEGLDQTRGRFRTLHILGHAIKGENAMKNVIVNGIILAEDGKKMSKRLKNYPDPQQLIEKRGGDSFRLHMLASPSVKAEPMRFNEKGTEQAFKDFTLPLQNVFNFFETYAKIDHRKSDGTEVYFMRHAECNKEMETDTITDPLTEKGKASLESQAFIETVLRVHPDIIISNEMLRVQQTAEGVQKVMKEYANKEVEMVTRSYLPTQPLEIYFDVLKQHKGKRILIVSNRGKATGLRSQLYALSKPEKMDLNYVETIELPIYILNNDLDKRILAELHKTILIVDTYLQQYILDEATKAAMDFMDKLTNRRLRRSRRRFRSNGMNDDKHAAYATLYWVLRRYLQILAPFTPFITEYLRLQLANFTTNSSEENSLSFTSIHLSFRPLANKHYINEELISEITTVRKIIKLALFVRAKNKIAVKQPLQKLEIKID